MVFTVVALKALSNGTIAVCLELEQNEDIFKEQIKDQNESVEENVKKQIEEQNQKEAPSTIEASESEESVQEDQSESFVLLQYDSKGNLLFSKTLNYKPCFMTEVMLENRMCLVFSMM